MATINKLEDLKVWQKARTLCQLISESTKLEQFSRDFKLKDQIQASSGSIMDNIAEGFGRQGNLEFINFLTIANGSALEVKSQLYRAFDKGYITPGRLEELITLTMEICKMLSSLISYLRNSNFKGQKFKKRETNISSAASTHFFELPPDKNP